MTIEIKTGIRYEYECPITGKLYTEQRNPGEAQFFTVSEAGGEYVLLSETEFTYEQEIIEPVVVEEETPSEAPTEDPA
jgi:hypothetical protein